MSEITAAKKRKGGPAAGAKQPAPKKAKTAATSSSTIKSSGPADSDPEGNDEIDTNTEECIELKPEFEFPCPTNVPGLGKDTKLKISLEMIGSRASDLHTFMTRHFLWKEADWKYLKEVIRDATCGFSGKTWRALDQNSKNLIWKEIRRKMPEFRHFDNASLLPQLTDHLRDVKARMKKSGLRYVNEAYTRRKRLRDAASRNIVTTATGAVGDITMEEAMEEVAASEIEGQDNAEFEEAQDDAPLYPDSEGLDDEDNLVGTQTYQEETVEELREATPPPLPARRKTVAQVPPSSKSQRPQKSKTTLPVQSKKGPVPPPPVSQTPTASRALPLQKRMAKSKTPATTKSVSTAQPSLKLPATQQKAEGSKPIARPPATSNTASVRSKGPTTANRQTTAEPVLPNQTAEIATPIKKRPIPRVKKVPTEPTATVRSLRSRNVKPEPIDVSDILGQTFEFDA